MPGFWMDEITPEEFREGYPHAHCGREETHDGHGWRGTRREFGGAVEVFSTFYCPGTAPATPEKTAPCPRCGGSMVEPGTEEEGDWDSAAMRHHPYTGEPCTACNGSGKAARSPGDAEEATTDG